MPIRPTVSDKISRKRLRTWPPQRGPYTFVKATFEKGWPKIAENRIVVRGAREHNLKNVSVSLPRDVMVVVTGLSGSGKSSLAFDTIYAEGQRRYVESLSAYARQFLGQMDKPDVDHIDGLSPAVSIDQKTTSNNPRSTVATVERGLLLVVFWSMETAGERPSMWSTSGLSIWPRNCRA